MSPRPAPLTSSARILPARPARRTAGMLARLADWAALYRQRRALLALDPHLLDDIGLTRSQALAEAERPVWDAPAHWHR